VSRAENALDDIGRDVSIGLKMANISSARDHVVDGAPRFLGEVDDRFWLEKCLHPARYRAALARRRGPPTTRAFSAFERGKSRRSRARRGLSFRPSSLH